MAVTLKTMSYCRVGAKNIIFFCGLQVLSMCVRQLGCVASNTFATKTRYVDSFTKDEYILVQNTSLKFVPSNCKPIQINAFVRHGTRFPSKKDILKVVELSKRLETSIKSEKFRDLTAYQMQFKTKYEKQMADSGIFEIEDIAERFVRRYPELFTNSLPEELLFFTSNKSRTIRSAEVFQDGISTTLKRDPEDNRSLLLIQDEILRFFDNCTKYNWMIENNEDFMQEYKKFKDGKQMHLLAERISKRLELDKADAILTTELKSIYTVAACEKAILGDSPWLKLFKPADLKVMEYLSDLKHYWRKSYGHDINYKQSSPLFENFFSLLEHAKTKHQQGNGYMKGIFRFGHAETYLPFVSALGLFLDRNPLRADNFNDHSNRKFSTTRMCPFAANLALVLYHCNTNVAKVMHPREDLGLSFPKRLDEYMVQLVVNELPVKFPFCKHHLCDYDTVAGELQKIIDENNYEKLCSISGAHDEL